MSTYPSAIYSPRFKKNKQGIIFSAGDTTRLFAEDVIDDDNEIVAIETELGVTPKGSYADVAARLDDLLNLFVTVDQSAAPQTMSGRFTFPYVDAKIGKSDDVYFEETEISALGYLFPMLAGIDNAGLGIGAIKNWLVIAGITQDPSVYFLNSSFTSGSNLTFDFTDFAFYFNAPFGTKNFSSDDGILDVMSFRHNPIIGATSVGDGERWKFIHKYSTGWFSSNDYNAGAIVCVCIDREELTFGSDLIFYTANNAVADIEALRLNGANALVAGDITAGNDIVATAGDISTVAGWIDSFLGFKVNGNSPAADGTYANPVSITIMGGIITAIS